MERLTANAPREWVVYDEYSRCPYLPGQIARIPLRLPARSLTRELLSARLADGDRRQGALLYRPRCPGCHACEAIRIDVAAFRPNKTQRRLFRRGEIEISTAVATPQLSIEKVALYNRHKLERDLLVGDGLLNAELYAEFLVDTCVETFELTYRLKDRLVGVAIVDRAADALSAVYCFYEPEESRRSIGTYSILKQLELCRVWGLRYLYLGLYVSGCATMDYKARFLPHERLIDGIWQRFD